MGKQLFNIKGMMRDLDPSKSANQYAYEIRNLRLTAQEDSTLLALTTEKGNTQYTLISSIDSNPININGDVVGYCILNKYITLFTHGVDSDYIYRLEEDNTTSSPTMIVKLLYNGDLGFDENTKIESLGIYENKNIQKVYWIDGTHQPRFINIEAKDSTISDWETRENPFDFVLPMKLQEVSKVRKIDYDGVFGSGTIQYILSYYNKNGQQTAAFYQSPMLYTSFSNRGASPEEGVSNAFHIKVSNPDTNFDYLRIYSVFRTSENGTPVCKKVYDVPLSQVEQENNAYKRFIINDSGVTEDAATAEEISVDNTYVLDNNGVQVDIEQFLAYREGNKSVYLIDPNYYVLHLYGEGTSSGFPADKYQATSHRGRYLKMEITEDTILISGVTLIEEGTAPLRYWHLVNANLLPDITKTENFISYIDTGLSGEVVDYSEIMYMGGSVIIPNTMESKNNTLFFGNYGIGSVLDEEDKKTIKDNSFIYFGYSDSPVPKGDTGSYYMYRNQLDMDASSITTFKGGETYTFGIILQDDKGQWTDVIPIGSIRNEYYPADDVTQFKPVKAFIYFSEAAKSIISKYKRVKAVRLQDQHRVVCQGVLCPTVFNKHRNQNAPYAQASWFFRDVTSNALENHRPQSKHNGNIRDGATSYENVGEIQGADSSEISFYAPNNTLTDMDMFVDWNTLTLNSPDIEFSQIFKSNYKLRIVGILPITSGKSSMQLTWSTPPRNTSIDNFNYSGLTHNNIDEDAFQLDLTTYSFRDTDANGTLIYTYPIFPWHRNGSLTSQGTPEAGVERVAMLDTKVMASLREAAKTDYIINDIDADEFLSLIYNITPICIYQDDSMPVSIPSDPKNYLYSSSKLYFGSVDTLLSKGTAYPTYAKNSSNIINASSTSTDGVRMKYKSTKHGVFSLLSDYNRMYILPNVSISGNEDIDTDAWSSISPKDTIRMIIDAQNLSYGIDTNTVIFSNLPNVYNILEMGDVILIENLISSVNEKLWYVTDVNHNSKTMTLTALDENYYKSHTGGTTILVSKHNTGNTVHNTYKVYFTYTDNTSVTYYISHYSAGKERVEGDHNTGRWINFWGTDSKWSIEGTSTDGNSQTIVRKPLTIDSEIPYLYLAELYLEGLYDTDYKDKNWIVAGESQSSDRTCVEASIGDTYYQRYDCLKTYPYTLEDQNQIVEIFSFMCETRINIDGRYDTKRGQADNTTVLGTNFNLINKAYTQDDNFFNYQYLDPEDYNIDDFPNQIIWTRTKVYGSDIDAWTQIVPTSILDMDGTLGEIQALKLWNDSLICFQDKGIARIMYNERTTISTQQGTPVEIANSGKVDGSQYISNQIGCSNKESIQVTQGGIYFIDNNTREIYKWSQGLESLSKSKGFNTYLYNKNNLGNEITFYDPKLKDVYFQFENECLVYNEQLGEFTSFLDYDMKFLFPFKDSLIAVKDNNLWKQFNGDYLSYFGNLVGYNIELISSEYPTKDKTFYNLEFRADVLNGNITDAQVQDTSNNENKTPFSFVRVWNEYQDTGIVSFTRTLRRNGFSNINQRFRIWNSDIPRDSNDLRGLDRIRSPWARINLGNVAESKKTVIHDIGVNYL